MPLDRLFLGCYNADTEQMFGTGIVETRLAPSVLGGREIGFSMLA